MAGSPCTASRPSTSSTALPTPRKPYFTWYSRRSVFPKGSRASASSRRDGPGGGAGTGAVAGGDGATAVFGATVDSACVRAAVESLAAPGAAGAVDGAPGVRVAPLTRAGSLVCGATADSLRCADAAAVAPCAVDEFALTAPPRSRQPSTTNATATRMTPATHRRPAPIRVIA